MLGAIVSVNAWLAVAWAESVACTVKLNAFADVGVPVMAPLDEFKESPGGREPALTLQL